MHYIQDALYSGSSQKLRCKLMQIHKTANAITPVH